ncbi:thioredoxin family protein [Hymenobacter sp. B81]|uniref:thioredoxin family protein n=1 Tax=Hymenobacter sp. B81 TaxID=3344878 RepID=UPI0037DCB439
MDVLDTNDGGLRRLTHEHPKVLAKFTSTRDCAACELLAPHLTQFAADPAYADITFLRLDSDENPVARQLMNERAAPFFVSYYQGRLLECDTLTNQAQVREQLDRLRRYAATH